MAQKHTKTPWETGADDPTIRQASIVFGGDGIGIANCEYSLRLLEETEANAAFIVEACNAHERLKREHAVFLELFRGIATGTKSKEICIGLAKQALALCEEGKKE